jgi:hypothetical protein
MFHTFTSKDLGNRHIPNVGYGKTSLSVGLLIDNLDFLGAFFVVLYLALVLTFSN